MNIEQLFFDFQKQDEKLINKEKRKLGNPYNDLVDNVVDRGIAQLPDCLINLICYNDFPPERWNAFDKEMRLHRLYQVACSLPFFKECTAKSLGMALAAILTSEQKNIDKLFMEKTL